MKYSRVIRTQEGQDNDRADIPEVLCLAYVDEIVLLKN